jgi:hypothetical protein
MPSDLLFTIANIGLAGLSDAFFLYGAYLSLSVWRGLAVPIFRSRALWMAFFGIPFAVFFTYAILSSSIPGNSVFGASFIGEILFSIILTTLYVWIGRTVGTVIRLDYRRRDLLHWKRFRFLYWTFAFIGPVLFYARYLYHCLTVSCPATLVVGSGLEVVTLPLVLGPLAYGALCLTKGARTTRDMTFRSYVKWFAYLGAFFILALMNYAIAGPSLIVLSGLFLVAVGYCFYKMARFLVPAGKVSAE